MHILLLLGEYCMPNTLSYAYYAPTAYYSRVQDTVILFFNFFVLLSMHIYYELVRNNAAPRREIPT